MTEDSLQLTSESFFQPLGLQHFYDAFALDSKANLRHDAMAQFQLKEDELTDDLRVTPSAVLRKDGDNTMNSPRPHLPALPEGTEFHKESLA